MAGTGALAIEGISKTFPGSGSVLAGIDLEVPEGSSLALLGPSGCGKTTLLRIVAGLEEPDSGSVSVGERILVDGERSLPPEQRRVGMVFQDWALFSHLDVARNVGFGLARPERKRSARIDEALEMVGLSGLAGRSTTTLSGGQQQRVALARSLAPRPTVLLLDEPFSNLDATLRSSVRSEVRSILRDLGVTSIFVTHDQEEAFILGDRIAVMNGGRLEQVGDPVEIYQRPANRWVASFVGEANFVDAVADGTRATTAFGPVVLDEPMSGRVEVLVRPERLSLEAVAGLPVSDADGVTARVLDVEYLGHATRYRLESAGRKLTARESGPPRFAVDETLRVGLGGGVLSAFEVGGVVPESVEQAVET